MPTKFVGNVEYSISGNHVKIGIQEIRNSDNGGHTGSLQVILVTCDHQYTGGVMFGFTYDIITEFTMNILYGGYCLKNIQLTLDKKKDDHRRHTIMLLKQYRLSSNNTYQYFVIDWRNLKDTKCEFEEKTLYHGTTRQRAKSIQKNNFRPSSQGRLGPGIYFTERIMEAAKIASRFKERAAIIECKVKKGSWVEGKHPDWAGVGHPFKQYCVPNNKSVKILKVHDV